MTQEKPIKVIENKKLTVKQRRASLKYIESRIEYCDDIIKKADELKSLKELYIRERDLLLQDS